MDNTWFGSVKALTATADKGMQGIYQVKSNHELYSKDFIEEALEDFSSGMHIFMKGTYLDESEIIAVDY